MTVAELVALEAVGAPTPATRVAAAPPEVAAPAMGDPVPFATGGPLAGSSQSTITVAMAVSPSDP